MGKKPKRAGKTAGAPFTFDTYLGADQVPVVHVETHHMPDNKQGPICRVYLNDGEALYENPTYPGSAYSPQREAAVEGKRLKMGRIVGDGIECPYCFKRGDIRAIEDVTIERKVECVTEEGTILINGLYTAEGWDEAAVNPRYFCGKCCTEFQMPDGIEVDHV